MDEPVDELGRPLADHQRILEVLVRHEVDFLVVGGLAVITHGYQRFTRDVDVLPSPAEKNMRRLAEALRELEVKAVGARGEHLELDLSHPASLAVGNYFLTTKFGALDLVNGHRPDLNRYNRLEASALETDLDGIPLKFISKDDLIAMKREAGRPKDLSDIAALTEAERTGPR